MLTAEQVAAEVPAYGRFVAAQVARLGRDNPMVRTQFFSEEIDGAGGMFPAERLALMRGEHAALLLPRTADYGPLFSQPGPAARSSMRSGDHEIISIWPGFAGNSIG